MSLEISSRTKMFAAMGVVVVAAAGVTLAAFTDSGTVESSFTSGTLDLMFDDDQQGNPDNYLVDFSEGFDNMAPGDVVTRDLLVFNSGSINALVELETPVIVNSEGAPAVALQDSLSLVVTDTTGAPVELYNGTLTAAAFANLDIGAGGAGNGRTLSFSVEFDDASPVEVAGQSVTVEFPFTATQP